MEDIAKKIVFNKDNLPTISVCMIVKNEEEHLKKLLPVLDGILDEIIIVDTGSTDNTKLIANQYTTKVYDFPWIDDFSAARNESLKYATKDYILWLDADDMINRQDVISLKIHLAHNPGTGVYLPLVDKQHDKTLDSLQLRMFPNHRGINFEYKVHEQVSFSIKEKGIKCSYAPLKIYHLGYKNNKIMVDKIKRNLSILEQEVLTKPNDFLINLELAKGYIGTEKLEMAEFYTDKAISLIDENDKTVSIENLFYAYISKITLLGIKGLLDDMLNLLESKRGLFNNLQIYRLTLGELYFRNKEYFKAYKDLLILKEQISSTTLSLPIEMLTNTLMTIFLITCIYIKDKESIEYCLVRLGNVPGFKLPSDW